jgi:hypothetical protein
MSVTGVKGRMLALGAAAVLAGCAGEDGAAGGTSSTAPSSSAPATSAPQKTPATSGPSTTSTPTTTAVTVDPVEQSKQAVAAAVVEANAAYLYAVYNVGAPDALDRLIASTTESGSLRAQRLARYQELVDNGWRARPNPVIPDLLTPERVELIDAVTAEVVVCVIDSGVVYEPGALPDGSDAIVNDTVTAIRSRAVMKLVDGVWQLDSGDRIGSWEAAVCPPE